MTASGSNGERLADFPEDKVCDDTGAMDQDDGGTGGGGARSSFRNGSHAGSPAGQEPKLPIQVGDMLRRWISKRLLRLFFFFFFP